MTRRMRDEYGDQKLFMHTTKNGIQINRTEHCHLPLQDLSIYPFAPTCAWFPCFGHCPCRGTSVKPGGYSVAATFRGLRGICAFPNVDRIQRSFGIRTKSNTWTRSIAGGRWISDNGRMNTLWIEFLYRYWFTTPHVFLLYSLDTKKAQYTNCDVPNFLYAEYLCLVGHFLSLYILGSKWALSRFERISYVNATDAQ